MTDAPKTNSSSNPFDLEVQKTGVAVAPEEANVKPAEALAPLQTAVGDGDGTGSAGAVTIPKPNGFDLNKFKSKRPDTITNVDTLLMGLPVSTISQAKDFVRLHPDEENY
jgi:hypothetical protein